MDGQSAAKLGGTWGRTLALGTAVGAGFTLLLAACGVSTGGGGGPQGTLLIGGVGPLSQPGAVQAGQDMKWAMDKAINDVNASGGVLGKKLTLDFEDTQNMPDVAAAVAKKLVEQQHVVGVAGEYHSGSALAMIPVLERSHTPAVFSEVYSDKITAGDPNDPNLPANPPTIFRIAPTSTYAGSLITDWLLNGIKARKVVQLYEASDFGSGQAQTLKSQLDGHDVQLTQIKVQLNQPDYTAIVSRVKQQQSDADVVIFDVTGESSYVIEQNAFAVGLIKKGTICVANQVAQDDKAFWRAVPDGAGCVFRFVGPVPSRYSPVAKSVADAYRAKFNSPPKVWVFEAYDSILLLADAISRAKSTDGLAVAKALESTSYSGALGQIRFPFGSAHPVPAGMPSWLWHQWPDPPIQLVEYTRKGQSIADVAIVWPASRQTAGAAFVNPG